MFPELFHRWLKGWSSFWRQDWRGYLSAGYFSAEAAHVGRTLPRHLVSLAQLTLALTLLARGWLTYHWDHPVRGLIWYEEWWTPVLRTCFGISWSEFAQTSDTWITPCIEALGLGLMLTGGFVLLLRQRFWQKWRILLVPVMLFMLVDVFARYAEKDFQVGMAIEFMLQAFTPWLFYLLLAKKPRWRLIYPATILSVACCFIGHGSYAIGYYPVPAHYLLMTMKLLSVDIESARVFLTIVGTLDILVVAALLVARLRQLALGYMAFWGLVTALARVLSYIDSTQKWYGLDPWLLETIVRSSHWLMPLLLLSLLRTKQGEPLAMQKLLRIDKFT